jgi:small subunit ribosomal protein S13
MKIAEVTLNPKKRLVYSLIGIRGIGVSTAQKICKVLGLDVNLHLGDLDPSILRKLGDYITEEYGQAIGDNLKRSEQEDIRRIISSGSYRGLRHRKRMPVRGQRTSSNAKTRRGKAIGSKVVKKKK